jgi:L-malate glycosyltransferase
MKVLELCLSTGKGGLELYIVKILNWGEKSSRIEFFSALLTGSFLAGQCEQAGISYVPFTCKNKLLPLSASLKAAKLIDKLGIDIIHINWGKDLNLAVLAKLFSKRKVKLYYTRHMHITRNKKDFYHRFLYSHVDRLIVVSQKLKLEAEKYLTVPASKIKLLYNGVHGFPERLEKKCQEIYKKCAPGNNDAIGDDIFRIGAFSRIEYDKGQHVLLKAVKVLASEGLKPEVVFFGNIMDENYYQELNSEVNQSGLSGQVHFYGFHSSPAEIMNCFDLIVHTSYKETFGLVIVEAMRAQTAVIGTDAGGVPEIIDHEETGLLYEPGDWQGLAASIRSLIKNEKFRLLIAENGRKKADKYFSENKHFERFEKVFQGF